MGYGVYRRRVIINGGGGGGMRSFRHILPPRDCLRAWPGDRRKSFEGRGDEEQGQKERLAKNGGYLDQMQIAKKLTQTGLHRREGKKGTAAVSASRLFDLSSCGKKRKSARGRPDRPQSIFSSRKQRKSNLEKRGRRNFAECVRNLSLDGEELSQQKKRR